MRAIFSLCLLLLATHTHCSNIHGLAGESCNQQGYFCLNGLQGVITELNLMRERKEADHRTESELQCGSLKIIGGKHLGSIRKYKYIVLSPSIFSGTLLVDISLYTMQNSRKKVSEVTSQNPHLEYSYCSSIQLKHRLE